LRVFSPRFFRHLTECDFSRYCAERLGRNGENHEGMFFAVKYLFVKLGQTLGIAVFAMLTIYGKDPGNDFGLHLNGVVGFVLCIFALLFFSRFKEDK